MRRVLPDSADLPPAISSTRVRRAAGSDLDDLVALEQRSFSTDRLSRAQYRRHLDSDSAVVLIATDSHRQLLGSAVLFFRKRSSVARLYSLATRQEARGHGVGAALLVATIDASRQRGCQAMRLEVRSDNSAAIGLYERAGFQRIGRYESYYEDGADALRYELTLA
ncbi:GNAT family N-acetyltransferase [Rhodanobacter sp. AS-Z3]|uniref:GNAT family N-acetyltransferase n=1 Tax=Rhodanobacter sp. AS-Z3 TaxID=3031330 RepID=UPI00247A6E66|nr:GNAT family N-acetyltransferase [Rhodanobacter sp. AS-Z3]WEN15495.1 GNAT family N-acetyltransferase [Rhodanobacter sp. AS-Z3]